EVVRQTGSENYRVFPDPQGLTSEIDRLMWHQEEPFGSTSIYAQWNVFRLARSYRTKVVLDGQGADEILGGYHPFFGDFLAELLASGRFGATMRQAQHLRSIHGYSYMWVLSHLVAGLMRAEAAGLRSRPPFAWRTIPWLLNTTKVPPPVPLEQRFGGRHLLNRLYHLLTSTSLPALLHYEDRSSMAYSIEARVPFLDHRLVDFIFSLPTDQILRDGMTKVILRRAMSGILPSRVRDRADKLGFGTPEENWFCTSLRDWIQGIIRSRSLRERGYLDADRAAKEFALHCAGKKNMSFTIWRWINLELWFRKFIDQVPGGLE
ncbi:MAG: asparagine synthase C-terminal domain-containing protein, partial [Deltaproteobacteria bacterium]|nr:asparagine synthase C-terminal domain-containing protein [Deltaproteobacteria bacterium]